MDGWIIIQVILFLCGALDKINKLLKIGLKGLLSPV